MKQCIIFHRWIYRNPYNRRCKKCGRTENMFEYAGGGCSWEEMYQATIQDGEMSISNDNYGKISLEKL